MRLTLRTLLSYLDDTLEPAQAKAIGTKVAESEQALELVERIKQVTRRRRLTTPANNGPGGIDPNTIAEYMDNEVTAEKAAELEQICLASDVHLAEVAACHQILTLVLGEPALVPPSAKQRMYALVKGPEAIHSRKPSKPAKPDMDLSSELETDEYGNLPIGRSPFGVGGRNLWIMVGGGALAACLLVVIIWQMVRSPSDPIVPEPRPEPIAQNGKDTKVDSGKEDPDKKKPVVEPLPKKTLEVPPKPNDFKLPIFEVPPAKLERAGNVPYLPADLKQGPIGQFIQANLKEHPVLLQARADKTGWVRVGARAPIAFSGRPLMSLSGSKSVVLLESGIELTLWGNLPELTLDPILLESRATVHMAEKLAADLTIHRGRLVIRNAKLDKDVLVRVRFEDQTLSKENHLDIVLHGKDAAVVIERFGILDRDEPFFEKADDPMRLGPTGYLRCFSFGKSANVRFNALEMKIDEKQQPLVQWQSRQAELVAEKQPNLPFWLLGMPDLKDDDKLAQRNAVKAYDRLEEVLATKSIDVALAEYMNAVRLDAQREITTSKQISPETFARWRHGIRCYAAIDDVENLFNEFTEQRTPPIVRGLCMDSLYTWLGLERNHDYLMLDVVAKKYPRTASVKIMELFHRVSKDDARRPLKYTQLIENLNNNLMPLRALSHWHLYALVPAGRSIAYDPTMPANLRQAAVDQWLKLIPPGQLPPAGLPKKK